MGGVQFQSVRSTLGEVSAHVPFFLFHQTPRDDVVNEEEDLPVLAAPVAPAKPRMVRYIAKPLFHCSQSIGRILNII